MTNDSDPYFKNFSRIRVYKLPQTVGQLEKESHDEGILVKSNEMVFAGKDYYRLNFAAHERYLVTCSLSSSWWTSKESTTLGKEY